MSVIVDDELMRIIDDGIITNVIPDQINGSSIDITLGRKILFEKHTEKERIISLKKRERPDFAEWDLIDDGPFQMEMGAFILAHTREMFFLPNNISAEYKEKSSMARIGLDHLNAGWCDAGWNNSVLTLELKNVSQEHSIELCYGDRIGQMIFHKHKNVGEDRVYSSIGHYNGDTTVSTTKGVN